jgi:hypothetical protein
MSPAAYVIKVFGGVRPTARAVGRSPSAVSKWTKPRKNGGLGGQVPTMIQSKVLKLATKLKLPINPTDLIYGRFVEAAKKKTKAKRKAK